MKHIMIEKRAMGAMLGVHYGDSLGAGIEFLKLKEILEKFPGGLAVCQSCYNLPAGVYTDDTQMTMRVAKGIIYSPKGLVGKNNHSDLLRRVWIQFLQWYEDLKIPFHRRGAGNTCCQAIREGKMGTIKNPVNNSSGCGTVMRTIPVAIAFNEDPAIAFEIGNCIGALTHGHPDGWLSAGFQSMLVARIIQGFDMDSALDNAMKVLEQKYAPSKSSNSIVEVLNRAMSLPTVSENHGEFIDRNFKDQSTWPGGGWLAHYALAIALYAYRCSPNDPIKAVKISVNHSGDSDTVGAVCGGLVGAIFGPEPFEEELRRTGVTLEAHDEMLGLAKMLLM